LLFPERKSRTVLWPEEWPSATSKDCNFLNKITFYFHTHFMTLFRETTDQVPQSPRVLRKTAVQSQVSSNDANESVSVERKLVQPPPSESSVHGKEVHVATQKQTQKEVMCCHS
jgi:hypothetical protein